MAYQFNQADIHQQCFSLLPRPSPLGLPDLLRQPCQRNKYIKETVLLRLFKVQSLNFKSLRKKWGGPDRFQQPCTSVVSYHNLSKIHPWAINLSGSSKRGVDVHFYLTHACANDMCMCKGVKQLVLSVSLSVR